MDQGTYGHFGQKTNSQKIFYFILANIHNIIIN